MAPWPGTAIGPPFQLGAGAGLFALLLLLTALVLLLAPGLVLPEPHSHPAFALALRGLLTSPAVILGMGSLGLLCSASSWLKTDKRLVLAGLLATTTLPLLVLITQLLLQLYRHNHQQPGVLLADRALQEAGPNEDIRVVGKIWYSIAIRTEGRALIITHLRPRPPWSGQAS